LERRDKNQFCDILVPDRVWSQQVAGGTGGAPGRRNVRHRRPRQTHRAVEAERSHLEHAGNNREFAFGFGFCESATQSRPFIFIWVTAGKIAVAIGVRVDLLPPRCCGSGSWNK